MAYYDSSVSDLLFGVNSLTLIYQFIPRVIGALIVFGLGFLLGKWAKALVVKILEFH